MNDPIDSVPEATADLAVRFLSHFRLEMAAALFALWALADLLQTWLGQGTQLRCVFRSMNVELSWTTHFVLETAELYQGFWFLLLPALGLGVWVFLLRWPFRQALSAYAARGTAVGRLRHLLLFAYLAGAGVLLRLVASVVSHALFDPMIRLVNCVG